MRSIVRGDIDGLFDLAPGNVARTLLLVLFVLIAGCRDGNRVVENPISSPGNPFHDQWLGQWNGPEGTYLLLSRSGDKYVVKIQNLDGPQTYEGVSTADGIQFDRGGKTETIRAGTGEQTGMKWLLDKKNCLVVKLGEGFCRE